MKLLDIFSHYKIDSLEQLASGKIQDIDHIKLPREVLVEELINHLLKFSYVQKAIVLRNPPSFLILNEVLESPDQKCPVQGFKDTITRKTESFIKKATKGEGLRSKRDYSLYLRLLQVAWESDARIDHSEAALLDALREELDIAFTEHIILEHHESLKPFWYTENYYERERNHLIASGILHPVDGHFAIADEMIPLIRKTWGYSLSGAQYRRLLDHLVGQDLVEILKRSELQTSGSSEERASRIIENHVSPRKALNCLGIDGLRDLARSVGSQISGSKAEVVENIIDFLDDDEDLRRQEEIQRSLSPPPVEQKKLSKAAFSALFGNLSNEQLYSVASGLRGVGKSGSKDRRIERLWESGYSEATMLARLSNAELYELCSGLGLKVAGLKQERIDRLLDVSADDLVQKEDEATESDGEAMIRASTKADRDREKDQKAQSIEVLRAQYPFLGQDELIILSFILESKTVSGHMLERIVARFDLPWYFPETQMNDMIRKLRENGHDLIVVQKYSDYPLYQLR